MPRVTDGMLRVAADTVAQRFSDSVTAGTGAPRLAPIRELPGTSEHVARVVVAQAAFEDGARADLSGSAAAVRTATRRSVYPHVEGGR
ncbi:hypothetical protein [Streptomyces solincola]|uniref:hypothetical protein n=1 Tax=Streptomyces solincola TaxID=2100817 RepID=UPI0015E37BCE|nr:hypothetical protein [Streptomyces solincola]